LDFATYETMCARILKTITTGTFNRSNTFRLIVK
jgi:hypothetical protein